MGNGDILHRQQKFMGDYVKYIAGKQAWGLIFTVLHHYHHRTLKQQLLLASLQHFQLCSAQEAKKTRRV